MPIYTDLFDVEYTSSTYTRKVIDTLYPEFTIYMQRKAKIGNDS